VSEQGLEAKGLQGLLAGELTILHHYTINMFELVIHEEEILLDLLNM